MALTISGGHIERPRHVVRTSAGAAYVVAVDSNDIPHITYVDYDAAYDVDHDTIHITYVDYDTIHEEPLNESEDVSRFDIIEFR